MVTENRPARGLAAIVLTSVIVAAAGADTRALPAAATVQPDAPAPPVAKARRQPPDVSGRTRVGQASFYAKKFSGRTMADGARMDPHGENAASKTLPLGTTAQVTNLETGQRTQVTIEDRGPYVKGRIVDLSPATARKIGIVRHNGIALVQVSPIEVPLPGGGVKQGAAGHPAPTPRSRRSRGGDVAPSAVVARHGSSEPTSP